MTDATRPTTTTLHMCIAFFNLSLPGYRLALASNRDEFLARQTSVAEWRDGVLSGVDEAGGVGGTWLGVSKEGKVGVLLNIRDDIHPPNPPTRGLLVKCYLHDEAIDPTDLQAYEGCNLLTFDVGSGQHSGEVLSNRNHPRVEVAKGGWAGISNSPVEEPWPKVMEGVKELQAREGLDEATLINTMFAVLRRSVPLKTFEDRKHATLVPAVNLGNESSPKWYGTRLATIVLVRNDGSAVFIERDILELDDTKGWRKGTGERHYDFEIQ